MPEAGALADRLRELWVEVESARVRVFDVPVSPYEGGARPSSELVLAGRGQRGRGENVAWTRADHEAFAPPEPFAGRLGDFPVRGTPYERCAVEGALIDLALRQNGWRIARDVPLRTWVSFDRCRDPAARARRIGAANPGVVFKIDVHPEWSAAEIAELREVRVGVLDFKHAPEPGICERLRRAFPDAIFEDPPVATGPTARDQVVLTPSDAEVAPGEWVNLKGPRMGGWLALLGALDRCQDRGTPVYFGGMFELGVGRTAARVFAGRFAASTWHDLAHIPASEELRRPGVTGASAGLS